MQAVEARELAQLQFAVLPTNPDVMQRKQECREQAEPNRRMDLAAEARASTALTANGPTTSAHEMEEQPHTPKLQGSACAAKNSQAKKKGKKAKRGDPAQHKIHMHILRPLQAQKHKGRKERQVPGT